MSAPPLPEIFGNYVLGDFVEVVSPAAISWLPQTQGWLWLGMGLLVVMARYSWLQMRRWYRNRYRREAAARLKALAAGNERAGLLQELNRLLKLTAMAAYSRERVARLSGSEWIDFLNRQCASPPFSEDQGRLLAQGVYSGDRVPDNTGRELLTACHRWVREHEVAPRV